MILKFNDYNKINEENENFINNTESYDITNNEEVVIIQGRFQPMHLGHLAMIKNASKIYGGKKAYIIQIKSESKQSPFPEQLLEKIRDVVVKNENCIAGYSVYNSDKEHRAVMSNLIKYVRGYGFEPIGQACGEDREKDYNRLLAYVKSEKCEVKVKDEFCVKVADDRSGGYSGTKVREALSTGNIEEFKQLMPEYLWDFFDELKKYV